ncbi:MAG: DUF4190 domain-containing protein [Verrucomicrobiaceae bacterium]
MSEWFYGREGQQYGPIDEATFRARIATGEIAPSDLVWKEGMAQWIPLSQTGEVASAPAGGSTSPYASPASNPVGGVTPAMSSIPTSGLAIAALVCGILAIVSSCMYVGILFGIPAVICGHMAMKRTADPQNPVGGRGMAIAGLICGYLGSLLSLVMIGFIVFAFNSKDGFMKEAMEEAERQQQERIDRVEKVEREMESESGE